MARKIEKIKEKRREENVYKSRRNSKVERGGNSKYPVAFLLFCIYFF